MRTFALLAALLLPPGVLPAHADDGSTDAGPLYAVPLRDVTWSELTEVFDPAWILPAPPEGSVDLVERVTSLVQERWGEDGDPRFRSAGDFVAAARAEDAAGRERLLGELEQARPEVWDRWGRLLAEVLQDEGLRSPEWDPDDDREDDGVYLDGPWSLEGASEPPWSQLSGDRDVHQGVVLIQADLLSIKAAENDYSTYPDQVGAEYESIFPLPGQHVRARRAEGEEPCVALQIQFRVDLPFPFSDYTCRLSILNRVDEAGHLVTDVASDSDDFYWLAGRDVAVPLRTSDGEFAGMLVVRWFGFDLVGVPDGTGARRAGLRSGLGRLKLRAEEHHRARDDGQELLVGRVPAFEVRGDRRWRR